MSFQVFVVLLCFILTYRVRSQGLEDTQDVENMVSQDSEKVYYLKNGQQFHPKTSEYPPVRS